MAMVFIPQKRRRLLFYLFLFTDDFNRSVFIDYKTLGRNPRPFNLGFSGELSVINVENRAH